MPFNPNAPFEVVVDPTSRLQDFGDELNDPRVEQGIYNLTANEVGGQGAAAHQAFIETLFNRAQARGQSLLQTINDRSYYPRISFRPRPGANYQDNLLAAFQGSDITGGATGNASGNVGFAGGPQTLAAGGERFGIEGPDFGGRRRRSGGFDPSKPYELVDEPSPTGGGRVLMAGEQAAPPTTAPGVLDPLGVKELGSQAMVADVAARQAAQPSAFDKFMSFLRKPSQETVMGFPLRRLEQAVQEPIAASGKEIIQGFYPPAAAALEAAKGVPSEAPILTGATEGVMEQVAKMSSPGGIALTGIIPTGPVGRVAAAGFTAQGLTQFPELYRRFMATDDPAEKAKIAAEAAVAISPSIGLLPKGKVAAPREEPAPPTTPEAPKAPPIEESPVTALGQVARYQPPRTTADITRFIIDRNKVINEELGPLLQQQKLMQDAGLRLDPGAEARIAELQAELAKPNIPEGGDGSAIEERNVAQGGVPEHQGVPPGPDVSAYERQIRENQSGQASSSGGVGREAPEQAAVGGEPVRGTQADVESARAAAGVDPYERELTRTWGKAADVARARDLRYPGYDERLAQKVAKKPRPLTDDEHVSLLRNWQKAELDHKGAVDAVNSAPDVATKEVAMDRLAAAKDRLQEAFDALDKSGTAAGRGFNIRKMILNEFYSPTAMEARFRAAKGGKALNEAEAAQLGEHVKDVQSAGRARGKVQYQMEADAKYAKKAEQTIGKKANGAKTARDINDILKAEADAARARLSKERGKVEWTKEVEPCIL